MSVDSKRTDKPDYLDRDWPPSLECSGERPAGKGGTPAGKGGLVATALLPGALLIIAVAATAGGIFILRSRASTWLAPAAFVTGAFFFISSAVVPLGVTRERRLQAEEKGDCERDCRDLYWALDPVKDRTLKGLAWVNYQQLRGFTVIAQRQARMSYYASLVAAAISLLVLTSGAAVAIGLPATAAKVTAGVLATTGTVLSGFLVKTFLRAYQMASRQMSYYYGQPLVHCYLLHAQWLAGEARERFGDKAGFSLWQEVVGASIKAGADAQGHLLSMQGPDLGKRGTKSARRLRTSHHESTSQQAHMPDANGSQTRTNHKMA